MTTVEPIRITIGGIETPSETTMRAAGAHTVVVTTALPDLPLTVMTTYVGADGVDTTVVDVVLATAPNATSTTRTVARDDVPVTHARERCVLDHLAQLRAVLEERQDATATIDVPGAALTAAAG